MTDIKRILISLNGNVKELRDLSVRRVTNVESKLPKLVDWYWSRVKHKSRC